MIISASPLTKYCFLVVNIIGLIGLLPPSSSLSLVVHSERTTRLSSRAQQVRDSVWHCHSAMSATTSAWSTSSSDPDDVTPACVAQEARSLNLFVQTPLIHSIPLSNLCSPHKVYLKLDLLQPSGSFKDRGMAHLCTTVRKKYAASHDQVAGLTSESHNETNHVTPKIQLISSSGGNAGLAVTTVARNIPDVTVSVIVPQTTKPFVIEKLKNLGADVTVFGKVWNEADELARNLVEESQKNGNGQAIYVSPFDNPLLWTGHSTVVDEIVSELLQLEKPSSNVRIGALLASVGGGGLLAGILEGVERNYYSESKYRSSAVSGMKVVACETKGAASFAASFNAATALSDGKIILGTNEIKPVRLDGIDSIATSLGALEVTPTVIHRCHRHQERGRDTGSGDNVLAFVCTDAEAIDACVRFASDHRMLVEPACGAALAPLYSDRLRSELLRELDSKDPVIVVEVCGGSGVSLDLLEAWKKEFL